MNCLDSPVNPLTRYLPRMITARLGSLPSVPPLPWAPVSLPLPSPFFSLLCPSLTPSLTLTPSHSLSHSLSLPLSLSTRASRLSELCRAQKRGANNRAVQTELRGR